MIGMKRLALPALALLAFTAPASAQETGAPATLDERIAPAFEQPEGMRPEPLGAVPEAASPEETDVSLNPSADPKQLKTTLEPVDIEQRIDKGLTAAGEPPSDGSRRPASRRSSHWTTSTSRPSRR